jgi:guanine deaminase
MAASVLVSKTIYYGAFAHCVALAELEVVGNGAIGVDEQGVISFVEKEVEVEDLRRRYEGWNDANIVKVTDGFFFPGFIGEYVPYKRNPKRANVARDGRNHTTIVYQAIDA